MRTRPYKYRSTGQWTVDHCFSSRRVFRNSMANSHGAKVENSFDVCSLFFDLLFWFFGPFWFCSHVRLVWSGGANLSAQCEPLTAIDLKNAKTDILLFSRIVCVPCLTKYDIFLCGIYIRPSLCEIVLGWYCFYNFIIKLVFLLGQENLRFRLRFHSTWMGLKYKRICMTY